MKDVSKLTDDEISLMVKTLSLEMAKREKEKEISKIPTPLNNIDWSNVIDFAKQIVQSVADGEGEIKDQTQWMWECVMESVFGENFFRWYNEKV